MVSTKVVSPHTKLECPSPNHTVRRRPQAPIRRPVWAHRQDQDPLRTTRVRPPLARKRLLPLQPAGATHLSRQRTEHFLLAQLESSPNLTPHRRARSH